MKKRGRPKKTGKVILLKPSIFLRLTTPEDGAGEDDDLSWLLDVPQRQMASAIKIALRTGKPMLMVTTYPASRESG